MASVTPLAGIANALLLQRLKWPVAMVRWRAAREIRELLRSVDTRQAIAAELLTFLSRCETESDVCSVLSLLVMTEPAARPDKNEVIARVGCPSILADFLLEVLYGPGSALGGWERAHSGEVPDEFEPDDYFLQHKAAHLPPIFFTELRDLANKTRLPFVNQWAWEWKNLRDRLGTGYTLYPHYFDGYGETRSGVVGQYQQRQTEIFRSALLRTFSLAATDWGMPTRLAVDHLLEHIPAIGGLFDLDPSERPACVGDLPEKCLAGDSDLESILREWVRMNRRGARNCVSLVSPFPFESAKYGDVYVGAFLVTPDFQLPTDNGLYEPMDFTLVRDTLSLQGVVQTTTLDHMKRDGSAGWSVPVCSSLFPIPHGYWNSDFFAIGLPIVTPYCLQTKVAVQVRGGFLAQIAGENILATTTVWNDTWTSNYAIGGTTRCGAAAELKNEIFRQLPGSVSAGLRLAWFIKSRVWKRAKEYDEYALEVRQAIILDEAA